MCQEYIEDLNHLLSIAKHPKSISLLQTAIEQQRSLLREQTVALEVPKAEGTGPSNHEPRIYSTRITQYGWDQSEKFVKIYISNIPGLDGLRQENVKHCFTHKSFEIELENVSQKNYCLCINDLQAPIIPEECVVKVKSGMVIVSLRKADKSQWAFLTGTEKKLKDSKDMADIMEIWELGTSGHVMCPDYFKLQFYQKNIYFVPDIYGGSKASKVDKDEDPGASIMNLMKQMYADGDDEMKRTIAKAWHETQSKRAHGEL